MNTRKRAFTLLELLVVIGVIALLISIIVPSMARARARAKEVRCATLLRGWGQAFYNYAAEFAGVLPHSGDRMRNPISYRGLYYPLLPQNEASYKYVLPPLMNQKSWLDFPNGAKPTGGIYQCPDAVVLSDQEYGYPPSYWGYHSFCMNMFLDADRASALPPGIPPYPSFLQISKAQSPSSTILLYETSLNPTNAYGQSGYPGTISCQQGMFGNDGPENFGDRHPHQAGKLGGNIVFLDGHIEWRDKLWNPDYPDPSIPPVTDRLWWPYAN